MPNAYVNKVEVNGATIIDLTTDTITAENVIEGYVFHGASGATVVGTLTHLTNAEIDEIMGGSGGSGIDGDNLAYGAPIVGTAIVGSAVLTE